MTRLLVSTELAEAFRAEGLARVDQPRRSGIVEILVQGAEPAAVVISLLQGPLTVAQIARAITRWRDRKPKDTKGLMIKGPNVEFRVDDIDSDIGLERAAVAVVRLIAAQQAPEVAGTSSDDLIP